MPAGIGRRLGEFIAAITAVRAGSLIVIRDDCELSLQMDNVWHFGGELGVNERCTFELSFKRILGRMNFTQTSFYRAGPDAHKTEINQSDATFC